MREFYVTTNILEKRGVAENEILILSKAGFTDTFTEFAKDIYNWCDATNIEADFISKWYEDGYDHSVWQVDDSNQRTMFALKWGNSQNI